MTSNNLRPGQLLLVDPRHLPSDVVIALTTPNPYGVAAAAVVPPSFGDSIFGAETRRRLDRGSALDGFLSEVLIADPDARMERTAVFRLFCEYAEEAGRRDLMAWSARALYRALADRGYPMQGSGGRRFIRGLRRVDRVRACLDDVFEVEQ